MVSSGLTHKNRNIFPILPYQSKLVKNESAQLIMMKILFYQFPYKGKLFELCVQRPGYLKVIYR